MKIATVLLSSDPVSIMRRHRGMISVVKRKLMTSDESFLTNAPMTPSEVNRRYSKGRDFDVVLRNGYRKRGMWAIYVRNFTTSCKQLHTIQEQCSCLIVGCNAL